MNGYELRMAGPADVEGARSVMLDTFYRVFDCGYRADWHADVIDIEGAYLRPPRHALFVATLDGRVVATTAVRAAAPNHPPHPLWLVQRYPAATTAQLFRVYVRPEHQRRGLARALVGRAVEFASAQPVYRDIYLHTDTRVPGAESFWRSMADLVHDPRDGRAGCSWTVHFEIPLLTSLVSPSSPAGQERSDHRYEARCTPTPHR